MAFCFGSILSSMFQLSWKFSQFSYCQYSFSMSALKLCMCLLVLLFPFSPMVSPSLLSSSLIHKHFFHCVCCAAIWLNALLNTNTNKNNIEWRKAKKPLSEYDTHTHQVVKWTRGSVAYLKPRMKCLYCNEWELHFPSSERSIIWKIYCCCYYYYYYASTATVTAFLVLFALLLRTPIHACNQTRTHDAEYCDFFKLVQIL